MTYCVLPHIGPFWTCVGIGGLVGMLQILRPSEVLEAIWIEGRYKHCTLSINTLVRILLCLALSLFFFLFRLFGLYFCINIRCYSRVSFFSLITKMNSCLDHLFQIEFSFFCHFSPYFSSLTCSFSKKKMRFSQWFSMYI